MDNWQDQIKDMVNSDSDGFKAAVDKMKDTATKQQVEQIQKVNVDFQKLCEERRNAKPIECVGCAYEKEPKTMSICASCARIDGGTTDFYTPPGTAWAKLHEQNLPATPTRSSILQAAEQMVNGSRQEDYGEPEDNFSVIARLWSAYCGYEFLAHDVAIMMVLLKVGRISSGKYNPDNYIDGPGYFACAGEIAGRRHE